MLGLKLATADASFAMDEGLLTLDYQPASGAGAVRLKPLLQAAADPPVLELGGATPLLDRVPLTQAFTDTVLALVNPLLRGCATGDGMVSLALAETRVPLGADMGRRLDTTFALSLIHI